MCDADDIQGYVSPTAMARVTVAKFRATWLAPCTHPLELRLEGGLYLCAQCDRPFIRNVSRTVRTPW